VQGKELLARLVTDPGAVDLLPREQVPEVVAELERLKLILEARYLTSPSPVPPSRSPALDGDELLTAEEAARRLGVSKRWLYEHASGLPFSRRLGGRTVRFSARGVEKWLERHCRLAQR
jgi:excisionase family DNA binding protein